MFTGRGSVRARFECGATGRLCRARVAFWLVLISDPTGSSLSRAGAQARAEDPNLAEWARKFQGDDEDEVPLLPAHLEAHWVVLSCEPWNMIVNLAPYFGLVVVDMWDFKTKLAVRPAARARLSGPLGVGR